MNDFLLLILILFANIVLAYIPARIAEKKGYSFLGFYLMGLFFSFPLALVIALIVSEKLGGKSELPTVDADGLPTRVNCPYCAEMVRVDAKICKHCQRDVGQQLSDIIKSKRLDIVKAERQEAEQQQKQESVARARREEAESIRNQRRLRRRQFLRRKSTVVSAAFIAALLIAVGTWVGGAAIGEQVQFENRVSAEMAPYEDWSTTIKACGQPSFVTSIQTSDNNSALSLTRHSLNLSQAELNKFLVCIARILPPTYRSFITQGFYGQDYETTVDGIPFVYFTIDATDIGSETVTYQVKQAKTYQSALRKYAENLTRRGSRVD